MTDNEHQEADRKTETRRFSIFWTAVVVTLATAAIMGIILQHQC